MTTHTGNPDAIARGCAYGALLAVALCWVPLCAVVCVLGVVLRWW